MFARITIIALISIQSWAAGSQNLVPDSSFEHNSAIPIDFSGIGHSRYWSRPGWGTTDLFCKPGKKNKGLSLVGVPQNAMGFQYAHSGTCYAGFFLFSHDTYREYLQTPLAVTLEKGKTYYLSLYLSLANYAQTYIDQMGFTFLTSELHVPSVNMLGELKPEYIPLKDVGSDTGSWHHVEGRYKARGDEKYLIIGSWDVHSVKRTRFKFPKKMRTQINKSSARDCYYYVDDVRLVEWINPPPDPKAPLSQVAAPDSLVPSYDTNMVLEDVWFSTGKALLEPASSMALDRLAAHLSYYPMVKIEITGHTDNQGSSQANRKLSLERARTVARYLIKKGIRRERISISGKGDEMPVVSNDTEENRALNRRVEIKYIQPADILSSPED